MPANFAATLTLSTSGAEALALLLLATCSRQRQEIDRLTAERDEQRQRNEELTRRPGLNSTNSSKPPTSDGLKRKGRTVPDVAAAGNGDTVTIRAQGDMNAATGSASGGGTFVHRNSSRALIGSGTFAATRLIDFSFYGCDGNGAPSFLCGGRAALAVHLAGHLASNPSATIETDGILWVTCLFGSPPSGVDEGVRLNVNDLINFNKSVSGATVFIATS